MAKSKRTTAPTVITDMQDHSAELTARPGAAEPIDDRTEIPLGRRPDGTPWQDYVARLEAASEPGAATPAGFASAARLGVTRDGRIVAIAGFAKPGALDPALPIVIEVREPSFTPAELHVALRAAADNAATLPWPLPSEG